MIIDMKYHIASLIAVFLALGIGILVGSAVLGDNVNDVIMAQQKQMVDDLTRNFEKIRKDNLLAQDEIANYQAYLNVSKEFEKQILPLLVADKLQGKQVAIIETSNYGIHEDWINTLKMAGANITSVTTVLEGVNLNEETRKELATKLMLSENTENTITREIARELSVGVISAQNIENIHFFEQMGLIKTSGEYGVPIQAAIFVGGSQVDPGDRQMNLDIPMMNYFLEKKISVYGVETSDVTYSYMKNYQKLKISTVDNIDMIPGQVSLVMAVYGKPGNYGIKSTARLPLPALP